jgi:K+-transporting ATPase ATPase C chain
MMFASLLTWINVKRTKPGVDRAKGVPVVQIDALVDQHVTDRSLAIFGEPRVNVLELNLVLMHAMQRGTSP